MGAERIVSLRLTAGVLSYELERPVRVATLAIVDVMSSDSTNPRPAPTDSPWFWLMLFSAAGLIVLVIVWPKYSARQGRLELQFRATQEATRRKVEGTPVTREPGEEGDVHRRRPAT